MKYVLKKIILIERDADIRDVIRYILEDHGLTVLTVNSPQELDAISALSPDLILVDEWLVGEPGHRFCLRVKQNEQMRHIPVIILSTSIEIEQLVRECRADDFIRKPFDLEELMNKVQQHLA